MKRSKKWISFDFGPDSITKVDGNAAKDAQQVLDNDSKRGKCEELEATTKRRRTFNFELHLRPKAKVDLAVNTKKIGEVEAWLKDNVINDQSTKKLANFLLLSGPAGSGKTTTVQVLCEELKINVTEWVNPIDHDFEVSYGPNQVTRFTEFITESRWNSLFSGGGKKVILVEEFPNALIRHPKDFALVLEECYYKGNYPVIFVTTDSADNRTNLADTLFTQDVKDAYKITHISFNACASTLIKNALRRAHNLIQENLDLFKTPSQTTVSAIMTTAMGDIRCAINQYYFASLQGTSDLPIIQNKSSQKLATKRKRNDKSVSLASMFRDETLGLFHGLGRVLNPKRDDGGKLICDFDKLVDEFSTQPGNFNNFLFENYTKYFGDINDVCLAAEILSFTQVFLEKWVDRHDIFIFALWVAALGLMSCNEHRVSQWNQIRAPKKIPQRPNRRPETRDWPATDIFYFNFITKKESRPFSISS